MQAKQGQQQRAKKQRSNLGNNLHNTGRNAYEAKVIAESWKRGGRNPQIKGIIHEILIKDRINGNPANMLNGTTASLTKNPNAKTVDIIVEKGGKIISRIQAKDTPNSIHKTLTQIKNGQYSSAKLSCTKETVSKLNPALEKANIAKRAHSSGISSETTKSIAIKAGAPLKDSLGKTCLTSAKSNAVTGAVISGGIAVVSGVRSLRRKEKNLKEVLINVGKETCGGSIAAAGAGAASTACGVAISAAGITTGWVVAVPVAAAVGTGFGIKYVWDKCVK
jgi:hypothetical protein